MLRFLNRKTKADRPKVPAWQYAVGVLAGLGCLGLVVAIVFYDAIVLVIFAIVLGAIAFEGFRGRLSLSFGKDDAALLEEPDPMFDAEFRSVPGNINHHHYRQDTSPP